ncbi:hypothetical protein SKAU_G00207920 [Synaphobranchus kaupii]|uniref:DUF6729 domain-containing protein n=1 Tax=Synaphobranchus kaupii TaxID=118154 RepID=A0A9Q1F8G6_SYNKA|nr:hypothetical protein SKAU_G00207920 [Synaphobranchus kaupii]
MAQKAGPFFPGKVTVHFRKGALGFLRQDPTESARLIKNNPSLQDRSAPIKQEVVRHNAHAVVFQNGGDYTDRTELLGEYILQFGKYKGKSFKWLLENDIGYTIYLSRRVDKETTAGTFTAEGHSKDSLLSFLEYAHSFQEIQDLLAYEGKKQAPPVSVASVGDNLVGFGQRALSTWKDVWESRADGYAYFILARKCAPGTQMHKLQQFLLLQQRQQEVATATVVASTRSAQGSQLVMDDDEELEAAMLSLSPSKLETQPSSPATCTKNQPTAPASRTEGPDVPSAPVKTPVPVPVELLRVFPKATETVVQNAPAPAKNLKETLLHEAVTQPTTLPAPPPPLPPTYDQELLHWNCSQQQRVWMKTELGVLGLWPGSLPVRHPMNMVSLWRHPPQPELIDNLSDLPSPKYFQLHPYFIWKPESSLMERARNNYVLPCLHGCPQPQIVSAGVGRPRAVVGISGQYYVFASRLCCKACRKHWFADNPQWLCRLPLRLRNILPAVLTYKKAICKTIMHELRRTGKSPGDMANQVMEMLHLKYEQAHLAYLHSVENVRDGEVGVLGHRTITGFIRGDTEAAPFGRYSDADGWSGVSISAFYLTDCLLHEFQRQEEDINLLLQGTFGQVLRSDHTRKVARKVTLTSGTMSSYAVMNENWMILSWVMVQSESEASLEPLYEGLAQRYTTAGVQKASYQWMDRDCCAAFKVLDSKPNEHLSWDSWKTTEAIVAEATGGNFLNKCASRSKFNKDIVVKLDLFHCMQRFCRECVSEHHALYSSFCQFLSYAFTVVDQQDLRKLKEAYTFCGIVPAEPTKQHIRDHCRKKIPPPAELAERVESVLWHFHLATDPNNLPLFKPSMLKTWRIQRVHILRGCLSDPELEDGIQYRYGGTLQLNHVQGEGAVVPIWIPVRGTSQQEGYHFHQAQWVTGNKVSPELFQAQGITGVARWNFQRLVDLKQPGVPRSLPLPVSASPRSIRTGPIKTGGRLFVLDHSRWTQAMRAAIDGLLTKYHGQKDFLKLVDHDYAAMVHHSSTDPNSLLHPTTKVHISRYVKHLAKLQNTSSSLNPSPEKLFETQQLWKRLTTDSVVSIPVVPLPPAPVNPPAVTAPLTEAAVEKMVVNILQKQQQQQQQQPPLKKRTKTCLACGQPKSRYENKGSSVHFFYQGGQERYFYCSTKVYNTYKGEGLTNPQMSFVDFMQTPFFQREMDAMKLRVQEKRLKRTSAEKVQKGRLCRFCHKELKQGPNSPHIHTGFPGVAGKYIYCPAKVFSEYEQQGMAREMTWREFQASTFYEKEKQRWLAEKGK